ncbi:hypothetical protein BU23DRAFT_595109 [Bimuria novae-zelandiae CBS 107.79]|uniref:Uncharacterized protein n=1 Tax=Bimuria novae-zelandiae CBS 107.79 TaxID=1447943 RepID=A0A6A5VW70_9PLEO|nr:hypothetical protein BU23DRAFT_595109 [Bimuria novae-zelandiae CBS 107.79]
MHLLTFTLIINVGILSACFPTLALSQLTSSKCDDAALAAFIPPNSTQPAAHFKSYLQAPACAPQPHIIGLDAKNRFEEDYEHFAEYFNKSSPDHVPEACDSRFKKVEKDGKLPRKWDDYVGEEKKKCRVSTSTKGPEDGGKGQRKYKSVGIRTLEGDMKTAAIAIVAAHAWGQAMF